MSILNVEELAFAGTSHEFIGNDHGAPISMYIVDASPGSGPPLHVHPYAEVIVVQEGQATVTLGDEERQVHAGAIIVIPPETPHKFVNSGDTQLRQVDVHASARFIQTDLE